MKTAIICKIIFEVKKYIRNKKGTSNPED